MFLLRSGAIEGYGTLVSQLGQNPVSLLRDAGMVVAQLRQPNSYVSYEKTADLLDDTARQCQEPLFALRLASRQDLLAIGDVALSGSRQPTVGEALSFARQYLYLHASGLHLEQSQRGDRAEVRLSFDFTNDSGLLQLSQLSAAQLFNAVKILTGADSPQIRLHLQYRGGEQLTGSAEALASRRQPFQSTATGNPSGNRQAKPAARQNQHHRSGVESWVCRRLGVQSPFQAMDRVFSEKLAGAANGRRLITGRVKWQDRVRGKDKSQLD